MHEILSSKCDSVRDLIRSECLLSALQPHSKQHLSNGAPTQNKIYKFIVNLVQSLFPLPTVSARG